jgi:hypothetical protein
MGLVKTINIGTTSSISDLNIVPNDNVRFDTFDYSYKYQLVETMLMV